MPRRQNDLGAAFSLGGTGCALPVILLCLLGMAAGVLRLEPVLIMLFLIGMLAYLVGGIFGVAIAKASGSSKGRRKRKRR